MRRFIILSIESIRNTNNNFRFGLISEDFEQISNSALTIKSVEVIFRQQKGYQYNRCT